MKTEDKIGLYTNVWIIFLDFNEAKPSGYSIPWEIGYKFSNEDEQNFIIIDESYNNYSSTIFYYAKLF